MGLTQTAANGEQHGLINVIGNSVPDSGMKRFKEKDRAAMEKLRKEEARIIKARYISSRGPAEKLEKPYCRWDGDQIQMWKFLHNCVYEVPQGLVNEVNSNPGLAKRSGICDANGVPTKVEGQAEKLHQFVPAEF